MIASGAPWEDAASLLVLLPDPFHSIAGRKDNWERSNTRETGEPVPISPCIRCCPPASVSRTPLVREGPQGAREEEEEEGARIVRAHFRRLTRVVLVTSIPQPPLPPNHAFAYCQPSSSVT